MNYKRLYDYRFRDIDQNARLAVWREISAFIFGKLDYPRVVLDPAAGRREFISSISTSEKWVVDQTIYSDFETDSALKIIIGDILSVDLPRNYFDGIFVSNFLEHLPTQYTVHDFLKKMCDSLKLGGKIAIMGPNFKYCFREYFDCADHSLPITHISLSEHLYTAGLETVEIHAKFLPYSFRGTLPPSPILTKIYLKNSWMWPALGKQFLCIAKKVTL